jgi:ferric-dicitrate binding protein FerR (iron transport regulator)
MVQAIGTAFSVVRYRQDTSVQVVVSQGKVAVRGESSDVAPRGTPAVLAQGDAVEFHSPERVVVRRDVDLNQELSWLTGELSFRRMPLSDVVRVLERWYDVSIVVPDRALAEQRVTATFGREGVAEVISQLTNALGAQYRNHGRTFVLTSRP